MIKIVRIIPILCDCFSTKARVPVKITVETLKYIRFNKRVIECEDWDILFIEKDDIFLSANEFGSLGVSSNNNDEIHGKERDFKVKKYSSLSEFYDKVKMIENDKGTTKIK